MPFGTFYFSAEESPPGLTQPGRRKGVRDRRRKEKKRCQGPILDEHVGVSYAPAMARPPRVALGGITYHPLNRGNARMTVFDDAVTKRCQAVTKRCQGPLFADV